MTFVMLPCEAAGTRSGKAGLRRHLEEIETPGGLVERCQVGERASDVDGHAKSRHDRLLRRASPFNNDDPAIRVPERLQSLGLSGFSTARAPQKTKTTD
jgi:hypothetical protein